MWHIRIDFFGVHFGSLLVFIAGLIISFIFPPFIYAFGALVENSEDIKEQTRMLSECAHAAQKYEKLLEHKSPDNQKAILDALCHTINKRFSPHEENNVKEETA